MKNALLFLLVCLLPVGLFAQQGDNNQQKALVFTHVTVIDATGAPAKSDMTVVIKGGRIAALGKTANLDTPENAQVVDATGKFLIPGLWDMHVHPLSGKNFLALFPANGVTGIRVMSGLPVHKKWRKEISAGELIGPRMVIASPILDGPNNTRGFIVVSNEEEGRQLVRKFKEEGADFIKVYTYLPRDAYFAIADEAKKQGISFAGHVPLSVSAAEASDAGQQSVEHCYYVSVACSTEGEEELKKKIKETLDTRPFSLPHVRARHKLIADITYSEKKPAELFARFVKNSTWVCPTLIIWHGLLFHDGEDIANDPRLKYIPLSTKDRWKNDVDLAWATGEGRADHKRLCEKHLAIVGAMRRAGVGLLAGTDTTVPYCFPGFGLHDELVVFVQAGLSPMQALQTATYNVAKCLGKLDSMGTVEQGKIADLVLLDANPLQDISNTRRITTVVVGGRVFDKTALQKMLIQVEAQVEVERLHQAARDGDLEQVKKLIAQGADVNASNGDEKWTPLLAAAKAGHADVINVLLKNGAKVDAGSYSYTPLYYAIWSKDAQAVRALISGGADVNAKNENGWTPLHYAAREGHKEIVELLLAHDADVNVGDANNNRTAAEHAMRKNHTEIVQLLISKGADISPLHFALYMKDEDRARSLIEGGADVSRRTPLGTTLLERAVDVGLKDIVELLIAKGADVNAKDDWNWTPLHSAVYGHKDIVKLLIAKGANVNARNGASRTPLWYAQEEGHTEIVELLRKHGAKE